MARNQIRIRPCPQCGDRKRIDGEGERAGLVFPCWTCHCLLVVTTELTLKRATNADMVQRPIGEQYVARVAQRMWRGIPKDVYC